MSTQLFTTDFNQTTIATCGFTGSHIVINETNILTSTMHYHTTPKAGKVAFFWNGYGGQLDNQPTYFYKSFGAVNDSGTAYKTLTVDFWLYFDSNFQLLDDVLPLLYLFPSNQSASWAGANASVEIWLAGDDISPDDVVLFVQANGDSPQAAAAFNPVNNTWYHFILTYVCTALGNTATLVVKDTTGGTTYGTVISLSTGLDMTPFAVRTVSFGGAGGISPVYGENHSTDNDIGMYLDDVTISTDDSAGGATLNLRTLMGAGT